MQNNQLPFPIDRLVNNFVYTSPGNFNGQLNIAVNPKLMQYLPFMGTSCIEAIQAKANDNPLRVFLFNQMSQNAYNNMQFYGLVKLTADYAEMGLAKNVYSNPNDAIADSAIKMTELTGISNITAYPELGRYLPVNMNQSIQNGLNILNRVAQEMQQFKSVNVGYGNQQGNFANPSPQQYNQQFTPQAPQQQFNQSFTPPQQFNQPGGMYGQPSGNQIFSNFRNSPTQQPGAPGLNGSYMVNEPPPVPAVVLQSILPTQPVIQPLPIVSIGNFDENETDQYGKHIQWAPDEDHPFNLAYNKHTHDLRYETKSDRVTRPFTLELTTEKLMERIKHFKARTIPDTFIPTSAQETNARVRGLVGGLADCNIADRKKDLDIMLSDTGIQKDAEVELISIKDKNSIGVSDEEIWRDCDTMLKAKLVEDSKIIAYSSGAILNDPYVSVEDPKPLLDKLLACDDFTAFNNVLKDAKALATKCGNQTDIVATINQINKRMTCKLNRFINNQLALTVNIDSFVDEGVELVDYIHNRYGEKFSNEVRVAQSEIIKHSCTYANEGFETSMSPYYAPPILEDVDIKPYITYFMTSDYFVSLNCFSADLDFEIPKGDCSVAIFHENVPILYQLAALLYDRADSYKLKFNRCLIRTLDRKVYTLTRSCIDSDTFLIGLV